MKVLIAIITCQRDRSYERLLRETWLQSCSVDCRFFLGKNISNLKADEISLDVPDAPIRFAGVEKTKRIIRYGLSKDYDYLFKCDIDTYVHVPRLMKSAFECHDWSGFGEPYGGSGYWLSRKMMNVLVEKSTDVSITESEDSWVSRNLRREGFIAHQDPRYHSLTNEGPTPNNSIITSHWYADGERIVCFKERLNLFSEHYKKAAFIGTITGATSAQGTEMSDNTQAHAEGYPGRALPKSEEVKDAKCEEGTTIRCAKQQTGENRYPINSHVAEKKEFGPNN